jgi:cell division protein FtsQ
MDEKGEKAMKRFVKILFIVPSFYLILMPVYLNRKTGSTLCGGISIGISDSSEYHFVTKRDIQNLIERSGTPVLGRPLMDIPLAEIENRIAGLKELKTTELYCTIDGVLHVYADQRNPVMRVISNNGGDYFVDEDGVVIRRKGLYTPRLHIVGGNVNISSAMLNGISVLDTSIKHSVLKDIYVLLNFINSDNFWSAQIDQIYVDKDDEIDLIPRVGNQIVHLGNVENYEGKLRNLETFYRKVMPESGWNKYDLINLEFKDQIVCRKR